MDEATEKQIISDSIGKLIPKVSYCLFCDGTGRVYDNTVLLRWEKCGHCGGSGE